MEEKRREGKQMKKVKNKIIGIMGIIGLSLFFGMITPIEVQAGGESISYNLLCSSFAAQ